MRSPERAFRCRAARGSGGHTRSNTRERRDKHGGTAYHIQLCAQALCLEEMLGTPVPRGAVFDGQARRRDEVNFDAAFVKEVEQLAARMHAIFNPEDAAGRLRKEMRGCSMKPVCLPSIAGSASASRYLRRAVDAISARICHAASDEEEQAR